MLGALNGQGSSLSCPVKTVLACGVRGRQGLAGHSGVGWPRQRRTASGHPQHSQPMTTTERVEAIARLAEQLAALTTAEERALFPFLEHITDLIDELEEA